MSVCFVPLQPEWLPQAGALLAQRHQRDRTVLPELPARFEDLEVGIVDERPRGPWALIYDTLVNPRNSVGATNSFIPWIVTSQ